MKYKCKRCHSKLIIFQNKQHVLKSDSRTIFFFLDERPIQYVTLFICLLLHVMSWNVRETSQFLFSLPLQQRQTLTLINKLLLPEDFTSSLIRRGFFFQAAVIEMSLTDQSESRILHHCGITVNHGQMEEAQVQETIRHLYS